MGIAPTYHKVLAFTMGAILAGLVGAVSAHFLNTWNARQGTFDASVAYLAFVLIGGSRTFLGPVLGGLVLTALPEVLRGVADIGGLPLWLSQFLKDGRLIIFGLLLVLGTIFFPQGLVTPDLVRRMRRPFLRPPTRRSINHGPRHDRDREGCGRDATSGGAGSDGNDAALRRPRRRQRCDIQR